MNIDNLIEKYVKFIHEQFYVDKVKVNNKEIFEIVTPFLDRRNDNITLYAFEEQNKIKLTDGGYTLNDLEISGVNIFNSKKKKEILHRTLVSFGINLNSKNKELFVETTPKDFAPRKHDLIQAILNINDIYLLTRENVISIFFEEVQKLFDKNNVMYISNVSIRGTSGFTYKFDFSIAKNYRKSQREALILTINKLKPQNIKMQLFSFLDVHNTGRESDDFVIINDIENPVKDKDFEAFHNYNIEPLLWSNPKYLLERIAG